MTDDERAAEWEKAVAAWLDSRKAPRTRESYELTMRLFREFVQLPLYDVSPNEIIAWKMDMEQRGLATRLPTVDAESWDRNQPLSGKEVGQLLKKYARDADLGLERVHVHMLRHTAAELYRKAGLDIFSVSKLLAHSDVHNTQRYFDHMDGHENTAWRDVAALVGIE